MDFVITKEMYGKLGNRSLQGILFNAGFSSKGKVNLIFQTSSMEYCRKNNGPELLIVPDFTFLCLAESLVEMAKDGWDITIKDMPLD